MSSLCGAKCAGCPFAENCRGCSETGGRPFGGSCVAAEYIKIGGKESYDRFKSVLLTEINALLASLEISPIDELFELAGEFVNLEYRLPGGEKVKFLNDKSIYLGSQIEISGLGICFGVVADPSFILISSYGVNGSDPELVLYKKR